MQIIVRDDRKLVEVWLTNAEKDDPQVKEALKPMYAEYKQKKYLVAVFQSGRHDLREETRDLLLYNKMRSAKHELS